MSDERDDLPHPMQPVGFDGRATEHSPRGVIRFKANEIVRFLLDKAPCNLQHLWNMRHEGKFSEEDSAQLLQLIGTSVSGFGDSEAPDELVEQADEAAEKLRLMDLPEVEPIRRTRHERLMADDEVV